MKTDNSLLNNLYEFILHVICNIVRFYMFFLQTKLKREHLLTELTTLGNTAIKWTLMWTVYYLINKTDTSRTASVEMKPSWTPEQ